MFCTPSFHVLSFLYGVKSRSPVINLIEVSMLWLYSVVAWDSQCDYQPVRRLRTELSCPTRNFFTGLIDDVKIID